MEELFIHMQNPEGLALTSGFIKAVRTGQSSTVWSKIMVYTIYFLFMKKLKKNKYRQWSHFRIDLDATASQ